MHMRVTSEDDRMHGESSLKSNNFGYFLCTSHNAACNNRALFVYYSFGAYCILRTGYSCIQELASCKS